MVSSALPKPPRGLSSPYSNAGVKTEAYPQRSARASSVLVSFHSSSTSTRETRCGFVSSISSATVFILGSPAPSRHE